MSSHPGGGTVPLWLRPWISIFKSTLSPTNRKLEKEGPLFVGFLFFTTENGQNNLLISSILCKSHIDLKEFYVIFSSSHFNRLLSLINIAPITNLLQQFIFQTSIVWSNYRARIALKLGRLNLKKSKNICIYVVKSRWGRASIDDLIIFH